MIPGEGVWVYLLDRKEPLKTLSKKETWTDSHFIKIL